MFSSNKNFISSSDSIESEIESIISKLSLVDKIDLLEGNPDCGATKAIEHAGIPALKMADGPIGVHWWCDASTQYPAMICAAASWDSELIYKMGYGVGKDAKARGVHILLGPGINIYRSPLCSRGFEYLGEDPFLTSIMGIHYIRGLQSMGVAATVKHYAVNFQEYDRHNVSSDIDERTLHEIYLAGFKAAVQKGGAGCLMTAYNPVNGIHCSENDELINKILKDKWKFDGLVMSDWDSTYNAVNAAKAGLDLEMPWGKWFNREKLLPVVLEGKVDIKIIDDKIRRLLRLMKCFGWLDNEQKDSSIPMEDPETAGIALDVARKGFVLLKNEYNILPFQRKTLNKLAVVGPFIYPDTISGGGSAYTQPNHIVSILDGICEIAGSETEILPSIGSNPYRLDIVCENSAYTAPNGENGLLGEYFNNSKFEGTPVLSRIDEQINFKWQNRKPAEQIDSTGYSVRWTGNIFTEEDIVYDFHYEMWDCKFRVWINDELIIDMLNIEDEIQKLESRKGYVIFIRKDKISLKLEGSKNYSIKVELINQRPCTRIYFGWENSINFEYEMQCAINKIEKADAAVICVGFDRIREWEGFDRTFELNQGYVNLINRAYKVNKNIVVLLHAGGGVDMLPWIDKVKGLLHIWYPGQEGGTAIGEILFGDVNPSGKLPISIEKHAKDNSSFNCYHDHNNEAHVQLTDSIFCGYRYYDKENIDPLFPFGFGLSYTDFSYSNLQLSSDTISEGKTIKVSFAITNTGNRRGSEISQLYISDFESSLPRPIKELKGFTKTTLLPRETKTVNMDIDIEHLKFYDSSIHDWVYEPGSFLLFIGTSSREINLQTIFQGI